MHQVLRLLSEKVVVHVCLYVYVLVSGPVLTLGGLLLAEALLPVPPACALPTLLLLVPIGHLALVLLGGGGSLLSLLTVPHAVTKVDEEAWETRASVQGLEVSDSIHIGTDFSWVPTQNLSAASQTPFTTRIHCPLEVVVVAAAAVGYG